jgi:hypothetical protein
MAKTHSSDGFKTGCGMDAQWGRFHARTSTPPVIDNNEPTCRACLRSLNRTSDKVHNDATGTWSYRKPAPGLRRY